MNSVWFADFETTTTNTSYFKNNDDVRVWLWYIKNIEETKDCMGVNIKDFINYILNLPHQTTIYFHNLFFDGDYILKYLVNHMRWQIMNIGDNVIDNTIQVFRRNKTIYYINLYTKQKTITLKCSYQILQSSVNALAESVGLKKLTEEIGNYDFEPVNNLEDVPQKYKDYIINDVLIILRSFNNFRNLIFTIRDDIDLLDHITLGGLTREMMKTSENEQFLKNDQTTYEIANKLFRGGFTQFNNQYQQIYNKVNDLLIIDVNSAYPYFISKSLPFDMKEVDNKTKLGDYGVYYLKNVRGTIKKHLNKIWIFPNPKNDETLLKNRYVDNFKLDELWVFSKELKMYESYYDMSYEIVKTYKLDHKSFLRDYINTLFKYKKEFKESGNPLIKSIKILLNSVYGSMCLSSKYDNFLYFTQNNFCPTWMKQKKYDKWNKIVISTYVIKGQSFNYNIGDYHCFRYDGLGDEIKMCNKLAAAWITSMQRCKLFETILNLSNPNKQWMYADTDSLFIHKLTKKDKEYIESLISPDLGGWDIENKDKHKGEVAIIGAKRYDVNCDDFKKQKMSGVKRSINFRYLMHDKIIKNACLRPLYCKSGIALIEVDKEIIFGFN